MKLTLYQTLANKEVHLIEEHGPFKCTNTLTAWLGIGYYFWDSHIELAHYWGEKGYNNDYVICNASAVYDDKCWDLVGNGQHRLSLINILKKMQKEGGYGPPEKIKLAEVIDLLIEKGIFKYNSVRAEGRGSSGLYSADTNILGALDAKIKLANDGTTFMKLIPVNQVCLLVNTALSLTKFKIVYPEEWIRKD